MSLSAIRTKIVTVLNTVSGVQNVYNRERYSAHWQEFLSLSKTSGNKIDGWVIQMRDADEEEGTSRTNYRTYAFVLRHFYGFDDTNSSQITFEDFNETVCNAFRALPDLDGVVVISEPPKITISELRMFGSVLCHYCEILLEVQSEIQY